MKVPFIAVIVEGGIVQCVVADADVPNVRVLVIDYDADDEEDQRVMRVLQGDGTYETAAVYEQELCTAAIDLSRLEQQLACREFARRIAP